MASVDTSANAQAGDDTECTPVTQADVVKNMELFSRTLDKKYFDLAVKINGKVGGKIPKVTTWELFDKAFTWPNIRKYEIVKVDMDILEHFQDNLNTNITNSVLLDRFIKNAVKVRNDFKTKYHDGEFVDPALAIDDLV